MRIVHAVTLYDLLTGSGLYVYELARVMAGRGHEVSVVAEYVGGELTERTRACGVAVHQLGRFPDGPVDVLHVHQAAAGLPCLHAWPGVPAVASVHSPWPGDTPLVSDRIRTYVCVRPEIRDKVIAVDGVPRERTTVVLNPVDRSRFRPVDRPAHHDRHLVLFAATMSPARRPAVVDLLGRAGREGFDVLFVGLGDADYLDDLPAHARWERREVWAIEEYVADCDQVAGTYMGRTAIEGWMCGRPAWVYDVVPFEGIRSVTLAPPPVPSLLDLCDAEFVADEFERIYAAAQP
jgi:glycosyltransferase involved in cell wall biosynthesis